MAGIDFSEFLLIFVIGLIVLGPKRLPEVASKLGSWVGQARRMTRALRRQLEEELALENEPDPQPRIAAKPYVPPHDDDSYSPLHDPSPPDSGEAATADASDDAPDKASDERPREA